jgi:hypothetical protein
MSFEQKSALINLINAEQDARNSGTEAREGGCQRC